MSHIDPGTSLIQAGAKKTILRATIVRADGRTEELGVISYWHKNPIKRAWFGFLQRLKKR
jgi:hypothetical protein